MISLCILLLYFGDGRPHVPDGTATNYETAISLGPRIFVEKTFLPQLNDLGTSVENQWTTDITIYFWMLNSIPLVYMSILCQKHTILIIIAL